MTISVVIVASARSVMMFIDALYVRMARCKSLVQGTGWKGEASYNVRAQWIEDIPSLRRWALEGDEEHRADSPRHGDSTRSVHHSPMHLHWCDCCERNQQETFRSDQGKHGEDVASVQRL